MKGLFRKYRRVILAGGIVLCLAILVQVFRKASLFANTPLQGAADNIFNFLDDWAIILSASVALFLVIAAFMAIRENRRLGALNRIRSWATEALRPIAVSGRQAQTLEDMGKQIQGELGAALLGRIGAAADAEALGGSVYEKVWKAVKSLSEFNAMLTQIPDEATFKTKLSEVAEDLIDVLIAL